MKRTEHPEALALFPPEVRGDPRFARPFEWPWIDVEWRIGRFWMWTSEDHIICLLALSGIIFEVATVVTLLYAVIVWAGGLPHPAHWWRPPLLAAGYVLSVWCYYKETRPYRK